MCGDVRRRAYCTVVQHCRCPRRSRQDASKNEKEFPGKTEGGKGVGGEREGLADPSGMSSSCLFCLAHPRCFELKKEFENFHHKN